MIVGLLFNRRKGFILIFVLWVLGFLTVLAVGLASGIRQKIILLEKLDQRDRSRHLLEAVVKYSVSYISSQLNTSGQLYNINLKMKVHNNSENFGQFNLAGDSAFISYKFPGQDEYFGAVDEERKININVTNTTILTRLIERVLSQKPEDARRFAEAILDWRQFGESQARGFFSDEYYSNLEYPYVKKDASYEILDELLLVKGMTKDRYEKLLNYLTIYGEGKININTASAEVLYALGLDDSLIEKILEFRQGKDRIEATVDDYVFLKTFDIATEINKVIKVQPEEIHAIESLNQKNFLTTNSYYFCLIAHAHLAHSLFSKMVEAVIYSRENKIVYWKERI